jgi:hypothetical protein
MCVCNEKGRWVCPHCENDGIVHERTYSEFGPADDNDPHDPSPVEYESRFEGDDVGWHCQGCNGSDAPVYQFAYEGCCERAGLDEHGDPLEPEVEDVVEAIADHDPAIPCELALTYEHHSVAAVRAFAIDCRACPDMPDELRELLSRKTASPLELDARRAHEIARWASLEVGRFPFTVIQPPRRSTSV